MSAAVYPGSFDPVTEGHLDIIRRASGVFDELVVAVMINREKNTLFSPEERVELISKVTKPFKNVRVIFSDGLLSALAKDLGAAVIVKGLRALSDFEIEFQMALINKKLNPELDTMFLTAGEKYMYLSSSVVREVAAYGGDISEFVPAEILDTVWKRVRQAALYERRTPL